MNPFRVIAITSHLNESRRQRVGRIAITRMRLRRMVFSIYIILRKLEKIKGKVVGHLSKS